VALTSCLRWPLPPPPGPPRP